MAQVTFKGSPIHTNGELPSVGSQAKDFKLTNSDLKDCNLNDYKGKRKILCLVPSLDTSVCSLSAKKFNQAVEKHPGIALIIISADTPFAQKRVCGAENLKNITTLSMVRSKDFAKDYGMLIQDGPLAGFCARGVVVLDENNKVIYTELVPEITQEPNYDKALEAALKK
jgi:thiol peroxidase